MPRRIIIADDVRELSRDGELVVPADSIVTDQAKAVAQELGVRIRLDEASENGPASASGEPGGRVALASDHGGYELKEYLKQFLAEAGYEVDDLGTHSTDSVDYPDFAQAVAQAVASGTAWRGVVVDAAGIGSAIAANKVPGVRAALCYDRATARNSREHNDANVLTLGGRLIPPEEAREIAAVWLETTFGGGRHQRRIDKITALERAATPSAAVPPAAADPSGTAPDGAHEREQLIEAVARAVLCQLGDQAACQLRGLEIDDVVCPGCDGRCVENCADKARRVVAAGAGRLTASEGVSRIPADLAALIDHTLLKPEASREQILKLCAEARQFGFATVCVNATWVATCAEALRGSPVKVCTVVGFPLGATLTPAKVFEAEQAVKLGAQEIDMVMNVGVLKSGDCDRVAQDIRGVAEASHGGGAILKVILECALLTDPEKVTACRLAQAAGADFVKTSTGFGPGGATAHDVELMRLAVGPEMGVKAAGGIRTYEDLEKMLSAGATRIGASASIKILEQAAGIAPPPPAAAQEGASSRC
jgi:deoxyribose-phosphate aldolase